MTSVNRSIVGATIPELQSAEELNPYIVAIPGSGLNDGSLIVDASGIGPFDTVVYVTVDDGPTGHLRSHTMAFDNENENYYATIDNFFEGANAIGGSIEITTTHEATPTMTSGQRAYERWPVFRTQSNFLTTKDGKLTLSLDPETLPADIAFVLVVDTFAPVVPPAGWWSMSNAYSIQASGAIANASRTYLLTLVYSDLLLDGSDPNLLKLFWFNSTAKAWEEVGGNVHAEQSKIVLATKRFGTFMLFIPATSTPTPTPSITPTFSPTPTMTPTSTLTPIENRRSYLPLVQNRDEQK